MTSQIKASAEAREALSAFPQAPDGQARWLIWLEPQPEGVDESSMMVQIKAGIHAEVDGVNYYRLSGQLLVRAVDGWGYDSYHYEGETLVASTRKGVKDGQSHDGIVWTSAQLIRYNSRLPLVAYTPVHMCLSYRVLVPSSEYRLVSTG